MIEIPGITPDDVLDGSQVLEQLLTAARWGVMHHYDASDRDDWSLKWFQHPDCKNGYTWIVMDGGRLVQLADPGKRTPHAGKCLTPNANSVFYGICVATNATTPATPAQIETLVRLDVALFRFHRWPVVDVAKRIRGHHEERIYTPADTTDKTRWGKLGAKADPIGIDPKTKKLRTRNPVVDLEHVRAEVARRLTLAAA